MFKKLFSLFRSLFYKTPRRGEIFVFDEDNPWLRRYLVIEDVKNGWVKYHKVWHENNSYTVKNSLDAMSRSDLHSSYKKVTDWSTMRNIRMTLRPEKSVEQW